MISIIVPVYKVEKYLRECIESVLAQTYQDWELLLIDDGSPDSCPAICDEYAQKDSHIRAIHKENGGVSSARNVGLESMRGDYVFFLDADDCLESSALQRCFDKMETTACDIVSLECHSINETGCSFKRQRAEFEEYELTSKEFIKKITFGKVQTAIWGKLYKAQFLKKFRFVEGLKVGEDLLFIVSVLIHNKMKILVTSERLYKYRIVGSSVSRTNGKVKIKNNENLVCQTILTLNSFSPEIRDEYKCFLSFWIVTALLMNIKLTGFFKHVPSKYIPILSEYNKNIELIDFRVHQHVKSLMAKKGLYQWLYLNWYYLPLTLVRSAKSVAKCIIKK